MSETIKQKSPTVNTNLFNFNTGKFPQEEWVKLAGQQIAWNLEGTKILASGADYPQLFQALSDQGIALSDVVLDYVPTEDEETLL